MLKSILEKLYRLFTFVLLISFLMLASNESFSQQNVDRWDDQSDELPGTSDNTWIYVTVGVVAVAALVYLLFIAPSDDKDNDKSSALKNFNSDKTSSFKKDFKNVKSGFSSGKYLKSANLKDMLIKGMKQESPFKKSLNKIEIPEYYHGLEFIAEEK